MKKFLFASLIFLFLTVGAFLFSGFLISPKETIIENGNNKLASVSGSIAAEKNEVRLLVVGDIMLDRGVEYEIKKEGNGDFKYPFLKIAGYTEKIDILFGNLESIISDKGEKVGSVNSFRADPKAIEGLVFAGFDIVCLSNNHIFDYGLAGMKDNLNRLKKADIDYIGAGLGEQEAFSLKIKEIKETKIGFLSYNFNLGSKLWRAEEEKPGIAFIDETDIEKIKNDIQEAKKRVDILTISLHWGREYILTPDSWQVDLAESFIDSGADVIIGHHPHVVQPLEHYKNGWIAYSLGNFVFDQGFSEDTMKGLMLEIIIGGKKIKKVNPIEIDISDTFQPEISKTNEN